MDQQTVLVVDDEKNIRTTVARALESIGLRTDVAASGEEALDLLAASAHDLVLLDLRLPGIDGLEVLRRAREMRRDVRVVIMTAYGTVESAVEATRLGAVDFIQKPFSPQEIRAVARDALAGPSGGDAVVGYDARIDEARRCIRASQLELAGTLLRRAIGSDPGRPEAFNLLGAVVHMAGRGRDAQAYFRAALALDPTHAPAMRNLDASVCHGHGLVLDLGDGRDRR